MMEAFHPLLSRKLFLILFGFVFLAAELQAAEVPATSPSVVLATKLSGFSKALADSIAALKPADLTSADDQCGQAGTTTATCRTKVAAAWTEAAKAAIKDLVQAQEKEIRESSSTDGAALGRLNPTVANRSQSIEKAISETATSITEELAEPTGDLQNWLTEAALTEVPQKLAASAKKAAEKADAAVLEAFTPKPPTDSDILAELEKTREKLFKASETAYSRSVTCSWNPDSTPGKRLTCSPGLLLSGEEVSDVFIEGLPRGKKVSVVALIAEQRVARSQRLTETKAVAELQALYRNPIDTTQRLDIDRLPRREGEALEGPIVIEVHTHRWFFPTHGGRSFGSGNAKYWGAVTATLRDPNVNRLTLVSTGAASRLFVSVQEEGSAQSDIAAVPLGYARWKFEAGGFFGGSEVVDHEVRTSPDPANANRVIVREIAPADKYGIETGVLINFIPQNYQAIGVSLGFAMNEGRAPSTYVGVNMRVRTFGQKGLASLGAGYLLKSVTRFPGLESALDSKDRGIAADSSLLTGKKQYREGLAVVINLGFSFGPISGAKEATQ